MSKKAIFYTSAAIALTIVIIVTYSSYSTYRLNDKMDVIQIRIDTMNFFIKDVEKDINKGVFIAGFRTLLSLDQYIETNGSFLDDANARFKESFLYGTINQQPLSLMQGSTFTDWANKISAEADNVDIAFNFTVNEVKLNQSSPWAVDVGVNISLNIADKKNTSRWVRNRYLTNTISIIGFEDPLYIVNSKGRVTNSIMQTNITQFVVGGKVDSLMLHANNSWYMAHNDSPSFLMRLVGSIGNSSMGIESLVNLDKFTQQGLPVYDRSVVDSVYFGAQSTVNYRINNTPQWFKIDYAHLKVYQVENITI